ncbi:hypothetical protein ES332_D05G324900v1 [Gossypium tomentosum]|uniref:Uncharacterized protein n=1 Tax=Gossypium tomentosum TaxID=34277 RepID=A0A5D2L222_GOSTO|nr:hypothetical protein ES332_D05G324900v1 [Gossypium tomentosum]
MIDSSLSFLPNKRYILRIWVVPFVGIHSNLLSSILFFIFWVFPCFDDVLLSFLPKKKFPLLFFVYVFILSFLLVLTRECREYS